jgi:DNA-binding NtrC family response regulator
MSEKPINTGDVPKVLVVEDENRLRDLLVRAIGGMGFTASGARSAEEAIKAMEASAPNIMVLDLNLPGMSGMELFHEVRKISPQTQVVILTGFGDLEAAREAIRLEVVDFLTKPCHLGELERSLDRARRRMNEKHEEAAPRPWPADAEDPSPPTLDEVERQTILAALDRNKGNRQATAIELGISLRTLYYRLTEYGKQGFEVD